MVYTEYSQCKKVVRMRARGTRSSFETIGSACTRVHTIDYPNGKWIGGLFLSPFVVLCTVYCNTCS